MVYPVDGSAPFLSEPAFHPDEVAPEDEEETWGIEEEAQASLMYVDETGRSWFADPNEVGPEDAEEGGNEEPPGDAAAPATQLASE